VGGKGWLGFNIRPAGDPTDRPPLSARFPVRLNRRLTAALAFILGMVLLVGGITLFLAVQLFRNNQTISHQYSEIVALERVRLDLDRIIFELQQVNVTRRFERLAAIRTLQEDVIQDLEDFRARSKTAKEEPEEAQRALLVYNELRELAAELRGLADGLAATPGGDGTLRQADVERLIALDHQADYSTKDLSNICEAKITHALQSSQNMIRAIVALYLSFILAAGILIGVASLAFTRHLATPLRLLADSAERLAEGRLDERVPVRSRDEIGRLSHAFNVMAAHLEQHHEETQAIHKALALEVHERTEELTNTTGRLSTVMQALIHSERVAAIGQIAAGVTHGIRTPLSALAINLQLLKRALDRGSFSAEEAYQLLSTADLEVNRINRAVEEFFRYSRLPKPRMAPVYPNAVVEQVAALVTTQVQKTPVRLSVELGQDLPSIQADADQLREVLLNLAVNAIEAMPTGGELILKTRQIPHDGSGAILVRVADSGTGIAPEALPRIFEPFFSTKGSGLGLGLSIAMRIVRDHGGTIRCSSTVGAGTRFDVVIPIVAADAHAHDPDAECEGGSA
jgi:two-component system NtrC family sensor kinase